MQLIETNYNSSNELKTAILLDRSTPKYWYVDFGIYQGDLSQALAVNDPANTAGFTDVTSELLPYNWNTESYKKDLLLKLDIKTKEFVHEYYDQDGQIALITWQMLGNPLVTAMIQAISHWIKLAWTPYELIKISANNGGYILADDLDLSTVPAVPCKFKHVKGVVNPAYAVADPTATPPSTDPQYYLDWITNNS